MDDISQKLASILNDPDSMNKVRQMAENILGGQEEQPRAIAENNGLSVNEMQTVMSLIGRFNNAKDDDRTRLLMALKPHLSEPKREKVDTAVKILKMLELLPLIKESGLLKF